MWKLYLVQIICSSVRYPENYSPGFFYYLLDFQRYPRRYIACNRLDEGWKYLLPVSLSIGSFGFSARVDCGREVYGRISISLEAVLDSLQAVRACLRHDAQPPGGRSVCIPGHTTQPSALQAYTVYLSPIRLSGGASLPRKSPAPGDPLKPGFADGLASLVALGVKGGVPQDVS